MSLPKRGVCSGKMEAMGSVEIHSAGGSPLIGTGAKDVKYLD